MTTTPDSAASEKNTSCCRASCLPAGATLGFLVLRFWLAIRAIVTAVEKFTGFEMKQVPLLDEFGNPDASGLMAEVKVKVYGLAQYHGMAPSLEERLRAEPLMPGWMLTAYGYALGPLLLITGLTLLLGIATRVSLFVQGIIYVSLTLGMILLNEDAGITFLAVHALMTALALKWADHNRWSVCSRCANM